MITIDQLLESVDLDFEPEFVTKNKNGYIYIWSAEPCRSGNSWTCYGRTTKYVSYNNLKLAEFENKDWQECIYEVPKKVDYTKWIGKLCKFWDDGLPDGETQTIVGLTYGILTNITPWLVCQFECEKKYEYEHCEPVRPDDDVIYKDAVNELKGAKNE